MAIELESARATGEITRSSSVVVNDIHAQLNATRVRRIETPDSIVALRAAVQRAAASRLAISVCGGRHAMGGHQFGEDALLIDMSRMNRVLHVDGRRGIAEIEAGAQWPQIIEQLARRQRESPDGADALDGSPRDSGRTAWSIVQKQTGADRLSLGGALGANIHGRGLLLHPFVADVESFTIVEAAGDVLQCSRRENPHLFALAIGGYGLFGVVASLRLRLAPRVLVQRRVEVRTVDGLIDAFNERITDGYTFGDFQFAVDADSDDFLRRGVFSCYRPAPEMAAPRQPRVLSINDWRALSYLAHADKSRAFEAYAAHYLATDGQVYWSDEHQLAEYEDNYHQALDRRLGSPCKGSEMITEVYVPRPALEAFLRDARRDLRATGANVVYGTIRLIERDAETFLPWARERWACVVFNLHVDHSPDGLEQARRSFRGLIDRAVDQRGGFYLTYHPWATREQIEACYPQFETFLAHKQRLDPHQRFQSNWYRHYRALFE